MGATPTALLSGAFTPLLCTETTTKRHRTAVRPEMRKRSKATGSWSRRGTELRLYVVQEAVPIGSFLLPATVCAGHLYVLVVCRWLRVTGVSLQTVDRLVGSPIRYLLAKLLAYSSSSCQLVVASSVWTYVTLLTRVLSVLRKLVSLLTSRMTRTEVTVASSGRDLISSSCLDVRLSPSWLPFISFVCPLSVDDVVIINLRIVSADVVF